MQPGLVSIIVPVYNVEKFLRQTIDSIIGQSYSNWELILIDDKSTDNSLSICKEYASSDSRIKVLEQTVNGGAGVARNTGLDQAKGSFIAFLDSDDYWQKDKVKKQIDFLEANKCDVVYSWYDVVNEVGATERRYETPSKIVYKLLKFNNYILTSSLMYRNEPDINIRFSKMRKRQDWIFFLDLLKKRDAYAIQDYLVFYRKSKDSLSANKLSLVKENMNVISSYFYRNNYLFGLFHFCIFLIFYFHNKVYFRKRYNG